MTLAEQMVADISNVFLNTDDFGERILYFPQHDTPREIVAVRSGNPDQRYKNGRRTENQTNHKLQAESIVFLVGSDRLTGMQNPKLGDAIKISSDEPDERWDFGEVIESRAGYWLVRWQKKTELAAGRIRPTQL